jgi:hypothetical protein
MYLFGSSNCINPPVRRPYPNDLPAKSTQYKFTELVTITSGRTADVAENIRGALHTIDENEEFIKLTLAVLMAPD